MQERLGAAAAVEADDDLRPIASALVRPGQVLHALGQVDVVVVGEAARTGQRDPAWQSHEGREAVHDRRLAAAVGADDGDQVGAVRQALEVEGDFVAAQAVADAAEAFEGESERLHGMPRS